MQTQQPRLVLCRSNGRGTSQCDCWTSSIKSEVDVSLERAVLDLAQRFESVELPPVRGLIDVLSHARGDAALFHLNQECQVAISGLLSVFELRPIDLHVLWFLAPIHRFFSLIEGIPSAAERGGIVAAGFGALVEMQMEHLIAGREHPAVLPIKAGSARLPSPRTRRSRIPRL